MTIDKNSLILKVEKRTVVGRKVKTLRKQGLIPGNVFGKKIDSISVQVPQKDFQPVHHKVGETGLVQISIGNEEKTRPVLITNVQKDPLSGDIIHFDFHQVDLKEKITAMVPVELVGESMAVKDKVGILIQMVNEVEVEALPTELPEKLELDTTNLKAIDDNLTVADLKTTEGVKILTDPTQVIAKIDKPAVEVVETPVAPAEGEAPAEGQSTPESEKSGEGGDSKPAEKPEETK